MIEQKEEYNLNEGEIDNVFSILNQEKDFIMPSGSEKIYTKLKDSVKYYLFIILMSVIVNSIMLVFPGGSQQVGLIFKISLILIAFVFLIKIMRVSIDSIPYYKKLRKIKKQIKNLNLKSPIQAPWREVRKKTKGKNILYKILKVWGYFLIVGGFIYALFAIIQADDLSFIAISLIGAIFSFFVGFSMISLVFFRNIKIQLNIINQLKDSFDRGNVSPRTTQSLQSSRVVKISSEDYSILAKIERAQITRNQAIFISDYQDNKLESFFTIHKSTLFKEELKNIDSKYRADVEQGIDDLINKINSSDGADLIKKGSQKLIISNQPLIIEYQIDPIEKVLKLISIKFEINQEK